VLKYLCVHRVERISWV